MKRRESLKSFYVQLVLLGQLPKVGKPPVSLCVENQSMDKIGQSPQMPGNCLRNI